MCHITVVDISSLNQKILLCNYTRVWKIPFTSHNVLLPYIQDHNTIAFNVILEKR